MSAHQDHGHEDAHHNADSHGDHHDEGSHSTLKGYVTGFVLAVILTAIPFWLVMGNVIAKPNVTAIVLLLIGAVQIVVHMIYFLHMNTKSEGGWNMLALIFTIVIVGITLSGSLWVMYHMNHNMMPAMDHESMRIRP